MKHFFLFFFTVFILISGSNFGQQWTASVVNSNFTPNQFTFSVYLKNTGQDNIAFLGGQWSFTFNKNILNGGELTGEIISSEIDSLFQPIPPKVDTLSARGKIIFKAKFPSNGGPCLAVNDSIKIFEARFTNSVIFANNALDLAWLLEGRAQTQIAYYRTSIGNCEANKGLADILPLALTFVY